MLTRSFPNGRRKWSCFYQKQWFVATSSLLLVQMPLGKPNVHQVPGWHRSDYLVPLSGIHAIASPSTYPGWWVGGWVSKVFRLAIASTELASLFWFSGSCPRISAESSPQIYSGSTSQIYLYNFARYAAWWGFYFDLLSNINEAQDSFRPAGPCWDWRSAFSMESLFVCLFPRYTIRYLICPPFKSPKHRNPRKTWQPPWQELHWDSQVVSSRESQVGSLRPPQPPLMDSAWSPLGVTSWNSEGWECVTGQLKQPERGFNLGFSPVEFQQ